MNKPAFARTTVTAALPYANGPLHIGHLAGAYLAGDIFVRYLRAIGHPVLYVCGSDEHGVAITIKAAKEGKTPQELVDFYHPLFKKTFAQFNISFDVYARTSDKIHHETASEFFTKFHQTGKLEEKVTEQFYDEDNQMFLADRYIIGTCPKCANPNAYGDQCEKCGSTLSPTDLITPKSALTGKPLVLKPTTHWFYPLDRFQDKIAQFIDSHPDWKPNVLGQCKSWLNEGLQSRAITRDMTWGIPVPLPQAQGKVLYVWFDAPIGYISATKQWASDKGNPLAWQQWWCDPSSRLVHFIGKDNIVFHCIIFPSMLMEHGGYILPESVPANEFLNLEGEKISTSRNWAIWLHEFAESFPDKIDVLRYVLAATMPESKDNDFTWRDFQARNNNELIAIPGNFIHRVLSLVQQYYQGQTPLPTSGFEPVDQELFNAIRVAAQQIGEHIERYRFKEALSEAMSLARAGNKYLADLEPWHLIKTNPDRVKTILYNGLQVVGAMATLFEPFIPDTTQRLLKLLNLKQKATWNSLPIRDYTSEPIVDAGQILPPPVVLFSKIEDQFVVAQEQKLKANRPLTPQTPAPNPDSIPVFKSQTDFQTFEKLDLRVAEIIAAEKVAGADKLLKLTLNTGLDIRTVVSGIAKFYNPEQIVGQKVTLLANLQPRKIRGVESFGMILMAEDNSGNLTFVTPIGNPEPGSIVR